MGGFTIKKNHDQLTFNGFSNYQQAAVRYCAYFLAQIDQIKRLIIGDTTHPIAAIFGMKF